MTTTVRCPACRTTILVKATVCSLSCPRCRALVTVPGADLAEAGITEERPLPVVAPAGVTRPCPHCGRPIAVAAQKCRHCKRWLDDDEGDEDEDVYETGHRPCPRCGARGARRVVFTFWGSFYGPALFHHVRCPECQYAYNGKTGRSNLVPAIVFVTIPALLILAIIGGLILLIVGL